MKWRGFLIRVPGRSALALVWLIILMAGNSLAQDVGSGGIGGRPAYPREDNERTQSIFVHTLEPGQSAEDGVNIINNSEERKTVAVYAADSIVSSGGAFACAQQVETSVGVGSWISVGKAEVTLDSTESEIVPFEISVPENTDVGEHNGCIVIQETQPDGGETENGIGLSFRTAIRTAILVPGEIVKSIRIDSLAANVQSENVKLTPLITNEGNVSVDTDIKTRIKTLWSSTVSEAGGEFPVLRGETGEWNFEHDKPFWGGWYKTTVEAAYDNNPDNFLGEGSGQLTTLNLDGPTIAVIPQLGAIAIELGLLLLLIYGVFRLLAWRRQRREVKTLWKSYRVKAGATIKDLAKISGVSWQTIARANKLKPPYHLEPGQSIKLPPRKK